MREVRLPEGLRRRIKEFSSELSPELQQEHYLLLLDFSTEIGVRLAKAEKNGRRDAIKLAAVALESAVRESEDECLHEKFKGISSIVENKEVNDLLYEVFEGAGEAVVVTNVAGVIVAKNAAARDIFGYHHRGELLGMPVELLMPERYRAQHRAAIEKVVAGESSRMMGVIVSTHGLKKDGTEFPLEFVLTELRVRGVHYFKAMFMPQLKRLHLRGPQPETPPENGRAT